MNDEQNIPIGTAHFPLPRIPALQRTGFANPAKERLQAESVGIAGWLKKTGLAKPGRVRESVLIAIVLTNSIIVTLVWIFIF